MTQLRPYQQSSVDSLWNFLRARSGNPCIVLPTAAGKTIVIAEAIRYALTEWPGTRIGVLAHRAGLLQQGADKLRQHWPDAPFGIYAAKLGRRDRFNAAMFMSIQSVYNRAMTLGRFDLLLIDEAHRIPLRDEGQYRTFIDGCMQANPNLRVAGLTATPYRLGGGPVCGPKYILNEIAYEVPVGDLIRQGYICRPVSKAGVSSADLSGVHIRGGEYVEREMAAAHASVVEAACAEVIDLCANRQAWIIFSSGIRHAEQIRTILGDRGVTAAVIHSKMSEGAQAEVIGRHQRGEIRALVNVDMLTEGYDAPHIDAVVLMRSTLSAGLYVQMVGRGFRLHLSKTDFLVLDFGGNIAKHGPVDAIRPPRKPGQKVSTGAPMRSCPECRTMSLIQVRECPECGYRWPIDERPAHDVTASDAPILSDEIPPLVEHAVDIVRYARHEKRGKTPSVKVTYVCGMRTFSEWVCIEHSGIPRAKAMSWWMSRDATGLTPKTVDAALGAVSRLREPESIRVIERGQYPEIVGYNFIEMEKAA